MEVLSLKSRKTLGPRVPRPFWTFEPPELNIIIHNNSPARYCKRFSLTRSSF